MRACMQLQIHHQEKNWENEQKKGTEGRKAIHERKEGIDIEERNELGPEEEPKGGMGIWKRNFFY